MSKKKESNFYRHLYTFLMILAAMVVSYAYLLENIKSMNKQLNYKQEELSAKEDKLKEKQVIYQQLISEERITKIASQELGLTRSDEPLDAIEIDKDKIERIKKIIENRYE
jgi:cell division protein FtsL